MRPATGMDGELHFDAALGELIVQLANPMLGLRHGHAVAGNDHDERGLLQNLRGAFDGFFFVRTFFAAGSRGLHLAECAEQHIRERAVHRPAHDDRQDQAAGAVERAGGDQQIVAQHKAHRHGRQPGVGIQNRNHRRHIGAADRDDQQHAEGQSHAARSE